MAVGPAQLLARIPSRAVGGHRARDGNGRIDRTEPVRLNAAMQRVPGKIQRDGPVHRIDQGARCQCAAVAPHQRVKPHHAQDEHQWGSEGDLGRDQLTHEGRIETLYSGAAELLDKGHPLVIGIP